MTIAKGVKHMESQSTSEVSSEILLEEMQVEFEIDGRKVSTPAKAVLKLRPSPGIVFKVWDVPRNPEWSDESCTWATCFHLRLKVASRFAV